ncbi:hypothetical protein BDY19DRAFT_971805 [Irpex rosettiformis]|uniref:Uncharacterized protein n=1 Tax=Irpex rosettiformis TaxID=378272 RepID=A0ACB8TQU4_9APHY|nr:hypothetical protein BDY19DRAFT_971805 [Irpex rosettiformis]
MKIHKRLPPTIARPLATTSSAGASASRVRSNSCSSRSLYTASSSSLPFPFFDAPGTSPPARPSSTNLVAPTRLAAEVKAEVESGQTSQHSQHQNSPHSHSHGTNSSGPPPYSLVFSSGNAQSDASSSGHHLQAHYQLMFPNHLPFGLGSGVDGALGTGNKDLEHSSKRPQHRYHLDVGAYGIPKYTRKGGRVAGRDGFTPGAGIQSDHPNNHAVQVGEDAYFIRGNAMGVADGVGGWSKARKLGTADSGPSPSALFASRLMHYCCEEVEAAMGGSLTADSGEPDSSDLSGDHEWSMHEQLDDSLEDLADGLDVLHVLEKAFAKTLEAHVVMPSTESESELTRTYAGKHETSDPHSANTSSLFSGSPQNHNTPRETTRTTSRSSPLSSLTNTERPKSFSPSSPSFTGALPPLSASQLSSLSPSSPPSRVYPIPLMEGSSTALLAVLEHPPSPAASTPPSHHYPIGNPSQAPAHLRPMTPLLNPQARRLLARTPRPSTPHAQNASEPKPSAGAVLRIAHLGDSMAMLVRGEEIVWRTEEMWWNFNTPVQLGPSSPTRPKDAKTFSIPVQQDDILILASDGLSDNLWDEDILDEVVRFKRSFIAPSPDSQSQTRTDADTPPARGILGRGTLAGMLSEALCSRARCVSERRPVSSRRRKSGDIAAAKAALVEEDDIPFGRRAREEGRWFAGGKLDDISVLVAVVSPIDQ